VTFQVYYSADWFRIKDLYYMAKIHHQISVYVLMIVDFGRALGTSKVLDARRRGVPTEAYK